MSTWLLIGLVLGVWALLRVVGGEYARQLAATKQRVNALPPAAPPPSADDAVPAASASH